jgi:ribosomal protein S19
LNFTKHIGRSLWKFKYISKKVWKIGFFEYIKWRKKHKRKKLRRFRDRFFLKKYFKSVTYDYEKFRISIVSRSSTIPKFFRKKIIRIFRGHRWDIIKISDWHVGYKFGEFSQTRKYVKYKSKALKKSLKKQLKGGKKIIEYIDDPKKLKLRQVSVGESRRSMEMVDTFDKSFYISYKSISK